MATTYKATLEVQCWKEHTCNHCGTVYRYLFKRKKVGQGATEEAARLAVNDIVVKSLAKEVDMCPCPECGHYQPDMIGSRRFKWHMWLLITALSVYTLLFILGATYLLSTAVTLYSLACLSFALIFLNLWMALSNPNRDLKANRSRAKKRLAQRSMQWPSGQEPAEENEPVEDRAGIGVWLMAGCLIAVVLFLPSADWLRAAQGWPLNSSWHPEVVGPGDTAWVWFPHSLRSIKGYWRAVALNAMVANPQELGNIPNQISVTTRDTDWGNNISVKSGERDNSASIWIRLHVPNRPELIGKKLKVQVNLTAAFPVVDPANRNKFIVQQMPVNHTVEIDLAAPRAGFLVSAFWWIGILGGAMAFSLAGAFFMVRASTLSRFGLPTRVIPLDEAVDEDDEPRPKRRQRDHDEEEDEDEPRPKRRRRDEDEEDEEDEPKPKKRKRVFRDEDD
jgi:hypothetical protein